MTRFPVLSSFRRSPAVLGWLPVAILACCTPPLAAQTDPQRYRQGTEAFRVVFKDLGFQAVSADDALKAPGQTVLVVLGDLGALDRLPTFNLQQFLEKGGAVLAASDRQGPEKGTLRQHGIGISGTLLVLRHPVVPDGLERVYDGLDECPYVEPVTKAQPALFVAAEGPFARGEQRVATNLPSSLVLARTGLASRLTVLGTLPHDCTSPDGSNGTRRVPYPFCAAGEFGAGRLLVLADHSVFINDMMQQPDNGNLAFAFRCVSWLMTKPPDNGLAAWIPSVMKPRDEKEARNRVLFIDDGAMKNLDVKLMRLPTAPLPIKPSLAAMVDTLVPEWEKKDLFNRAILDATPGRTVLPILALALTAFLFAFGFQRLARASHRRDLGIKPLDQAVLGAISAEPLWKQRERSMLRFGNLWEPAQAETRRFFAEVLGGASPAVLPAVCVTGSWWRRWKLRRELRRLWRLAQGQANDRFSPAAFDRLRIRLRELRDASARGVLRFDPVDLARHSWPNLGGKGS